VTGTIDHVFRSNWTRRKEVRRKALATGAPILRAKQLRPIGKEIHVGHGVCPTARQHRRQHYERRGTDQRLTQQGTRQGKLSGKIRKQSLNNQHFASA
jgi:hypothetical protein